ncbi:MAG: hypothetical protein JXR55_00555 [Candidatus Fermentibacteraceae bacterium]|nr:hypothetical protein [Candidatus Fermentibacteraceae bacterium]
MSSCDRETREEGRQRRLDTFRACLPDSIRESFDAVSDSDDCHDVGIMLEEARSRSAPLSAALDSIAHAELIDTFSDEEIVYYFWFYFDYAIETGSVRGP